MKAEKLIAVFLLIVSLLCSGCSSSSNEPILSSDNPDLRCGSLSEFQSDKKFWKWAYENIPTVSESDISSGKYDGSYVCVDAWIVGVNEHDGWGEVSVIMQNSSSEYEKIYYIYGINDMDYLKHGEEIIKNFRRSDKVKFCVFVENSGYTLDYAVAIKNMGPDNSIDIDSVLEEYNEKEEQERKEREAAYQAEQDAITNPLLKEKLKTGIVYSGDKSNILGSYSYVSIPKDVLKSITVDEFIEFAQEKVEPSMDNWVSIICEDGTGITFSGCDIQCPTYGRVDTDGSLLEGYVNIIWDNEKSTYTYENCE